MKHTILLAILLLASSSPSRPPNEQGEKANAQQGGAANQPTSTVTTQQNPTTAAPADKNQDKSTNYCEWFWPPIWSNWVLAFAAIGAASIALRTLKAISEQSEIGKRNAKAAERAAKVAEETLRAAHRPYLMPTGFVDSSQNDRFRNISDRWEMQLPLMVELKNYGGVPAVNIQLWIDCIVVDNALPEELRLEAQPPVEIGAIPPNTPYGRPVLTPTLNNESYAAIFMAKGGTAKLGIHVFIKYEGQFGPDVVYETGCWVTQLGPGLTFGVAGKGYRST